MRVVPRRTVVGDIDRRFDSLSGSHHQSHVNCVSSAYGIYVSGQLSRDVIGCFKWNRWLRCDVIGCWFVRSCCYLADWSSLVWIVCLSGLFCLSLISRLYIMVVV